MPFWELLTVFGSYNFDGYSGFYAQPFNPLKNGEKHRVYAGVNLVKEEIFTKLNLTERMKLIKMPKLPFDDEEKNGER